MKKLLFLFAVLLTSVGAWAQQQTFSQTSDAPSDGQWAANTQWFVIHNASGQYLNSSYHTDGNLKLTGLNGSLADEALWCIVGDATKGYQFYNKAKGTTVVLGITGNDEDARATFVDPNSEGYTTSFDLVQSTKTDDTYWCMKEPNSATNNYWNKRGDYLAYWNSESAQKGDNASAFLIIPVAEAFHTEAELEEVKKVLKEGLGYPKTTSSAYTNISGLTLNSKSKKHVQWLVNAYYACEDVQLPENGKAYTFTAKFKNGNMLYMNYVNGQKVRVSTYSSDASTFVCKELRAGVYAFITEDGKILTWVGKDDNGNFYKEDNKLLGYSSNYATVYNSVSDWNEITVKKNDASEEQFGLLRLVGRRSTTENTKFSSFYANKGGGFEQAGDGSLFNNDNTSAWILTKVEHETNNAQNAAIAEIDATVSAFAHVDANAGKLGNGIGCAYYMDGETKLTDAATVRASIGNATSPKVINAIKNSYSKTLPSTATAYKMAFKTKAGTSYYLKADGASLSTSTNENDASVFYCMKNGNGEYSYVFISEAGKYLKYHGSSVSISENTLTSEYTVALNNFKVELMVDKTDYINSNLAARLGTVCITTDNRASNNTSDGCYIIRNSNNPPTFDASGAPYHKDDLTSAIVMTEVENYTAPDAMLASALHISKLNAKAHVEANQNRLGEGIGYASYTVGGNKTTSASDVLTAIEAAASIEEVEAIINSIVYETPTLGVAYVLYDVEHKVFLDINNLATAPQQADDTELAKLNSEKQSLYITASDDKWKIHTVSDGGKYLGQYDNHGWNSRVNEDQSSFVWVEYPTITPDGILYAFKNNSGKNNGFLGVEGHTNGKALFVDQTNDNNQLKLKLHEASLVYKVDGGNGVGGVVYNSARYANEDYIFADAELTESDIELVDVIGYTHTFSIDNDNKVIRFNYNAMNVLLKNKQHNVYMGLEIIGGTLDNVTPPTSHRLTSSQTTDYRHCWELQLTSYELNGSSIPCFTIYNRYYDWYVGKITERDGAVNVEKNIGDAGRFEIDCVDDIDADGQQTGKKILTFKCLNKTTTEDYWYLHQINRKNYAVVDWNYTEEASKWYMEEVTGDDENSWFEKLKEDCNNFKESVSLGNGVGQYSGLTEEQLNNLTVPEVVTDCEEIRNFICTMHSYNSALVINQPEAGFYRIKAYNTNKYLQNYSENNNFQLNADKDIRSIMYLSQAKTMLSYGNGQYLNDHTNPVAIGNAPLAWTFVKNDKVLGHYALDMNQHDYLNINSSWVASSANNNEGTAWEIEPVETLPFTFNPAGLGFATFNAPVAVELPEGVLAYVTQINLDNNTLQMYRLEDKVVPANTPVMLYCEAAKTEGATKELTIVSTYTGNDFNGFDYDKSFYGTIAAVTYPTDCTIYSLRKSAGKNTVGFYQKADGNLGGFKAWIKIAGDPAAQARTFTIIFDGDDATGLKEALGIENENVEIYDLSGRRLDKPTKGVNVVGGKLVIK